MYIYMEIVSVLLENIGEILLPV